MEKNGDIIIKDVFSWFYFYFPSFLYIEGIISADKQKTQVLHVNINSLISFWSALSLF